MVTVDSPTSEWTLMPSIQGGWNQSALPIMICLTNLFARSPLPALCPLFEYIGNRGIQSIDSFYSLLLSSSIDEAQSQWNDQVVLRSICTIPIGEVRTLSKRFVHTPLIKCSYMSHVTCVMRKPHLFAHSQSQTGPSPHGAGAPSNPLLENFRGKVQGFGRFLPPKNAKYVAKFAVFGANPFKMLFGPYFLR